LSYASLRGISLTCLRDVNRLVEDSRFVLSPVQYYILMRIFPALTGTNNTRIECPSPDNMFA